MPLTVGEYIPDERIGAGRLGENVAGDVQASVRGNRHVLRGAEARHYSAGDVNISAARAYVVRKALTDYRRNRYLSTFVVPKIRNGFGGMTVSQQQVAMPEVIPGRHEGSRDCAVVSASWRPPTVVRPPSEDWD